ncbi:hypothetical protein QE389_002822 [Brevundimonas sp. SORGH_AS 993]|nr:hypothetical protein [Brevundimonas sp. SORGH_AS_0993]
MAAGVRDLARRRDIQHRAGADQGAAVQRRAQAADAFQRLGRVQRHFQAAETGRDDGLAHLHRLVGRQPAQNGDQRQGVQAFDGDRDHRRRAS